MAQVVESLIQAEEGYIFTNDFDYIAQRTTRLRTKQVSTWVQFVACEMKFEWWQECEDHTDLDPNSYFVSEMRHRLNHYFSVSYLAPAPVG